MRHERCEGFSKGMRQKVALAGALVHEPKLIILDEPLTGLDAGSARQVKNVLRERVSAGGTVIMTTHILEVAERMADRIGVIAGGRLIAQGTLDELRRQAGKGGASLEDTFLTLVAQEAVARSLRSLPCRGWACRGMRHGAGMIRSGSLAWFARHELRLAWRDWISMMTAGDRRRKRTRRHRFRHLRRFHASARLCDGRALMPDAARVPTSRRSSRSPASRCWRGR